MIVFKKITYKNFLSSGNSPVTINLNDHKTTLIHGVNGSGKSTVLDAICYALFNKPFRNINLPQLVNSSNKKDLLTEIEFSIGNDTYVIQRGMKPKKFTIALNGEPFEAKASDRDNQQLLEQNILRMSMKSFIQVVILGSGNYQPFMQMNTNARRDCVEDFLDIKVFSTMSVLAKERLRGLKDKILEIRNEIETVEYKIDLQTDRIQELTERSASDIDGLRKEIEDCKFTKNLQEKNILDLQKIDSNILDQVHQLMSGGPKKKAQEFNNVIVKLDSKLERLKKELDFFNNNNECPTCTQTIDPLLKIEVHDKTVNESKKIMDAREMASSKHKELKDTLEEILKKEEEAFKIQQDISKCQVLVDTLQNQITEKEAKIVSISTQTSSIDKEIGKLSVLEDNLKDLKKKREKVLGEQRDHETVVGLLKDSGIKTQIVRKYLPVMNKLIRKYMTSLDFPIHFTLNDEFNETVSSPMYQNFSYASFSEGQKSRIDLSLLLTWREIGKLKNSVSVNLLILDEVFSSSLDQSGKELLFALLKYGMEDTQKVLVVDHTLDAQFKEKFDHCVEVQKHKGFSRYIT